MGYQGWFACPQDGSQPNRWVHWFRNQTPAATNVTVDFWPDISELREKPAIDLRQGFRQILGDQAGTDLGSGLPVQPDARSGSLDL